MPQFDPSSYPSQIFWFLICFGILYFFLALVILPRIKDIVQNRKNVVDLDVNESKKLQDEILSLKKESDDMTREAEVNYKKSIEKALKRSVDLKETEIEIFKKNSVKELEKSKAKIDKMIEDTKNDSEKLVLDLANLIEKKIFN